MAPGSAKRGGAFCMARSNRSRPAWRPNSPRSSTCPAWRSTSIGCSRRICLAALARFRVLSTAGWRSIRRRAWQGYWLTSKHIRVGTLPNVLVGTEGRRAWPGCWWMTEFGRRLPNWCGGATIDTREEPVWAPTQVFSAGPLTRLTPSPPTRLGCGQFETAPEGVAKHPREPHHNPLTRSVSWLSLIVPPPPYPRLSATSWAREDCQHHQDVAALKGVTLPDRDGD